MKRRGTMLLARHSRQMSMRTEEKRVESPEAKLSPSRADLEWVEIFKDRIAERLKEVLQEDMDWMTSKPILERLNKLYEIEKTRVERDQGSSAS